MSPLPKTHARTVNDLSPTPKTRIIAVMAICPRCGDEYGSFPAKSRANGVDVCSACGTDEALGQYYDRFLADPSTWPVERKFSVRTS